MEALGPGGGLNFHGLKRRKGLFLERQITCRPPKYAKHVFKMETFADRTCQRLKAPVSKTRKPAQLFQRGKRKGFNQKSYGKYGL